METPTMKGIQMFDKLKAKFNEDPLPVIAVGAIAITAIAKFIDAWSASQGRKAYARQIDYKIHNRR